MSDAAQLSPAESARRRFELEQAEHSGEMEGLHITPAARADAEEWVARAGWTLTRSYVAAGHATGSSEPLRPTPQSLARPICRMPASPASSNSQTIRSSSSRPAMGTPVR